MKEAFFNIIAMLMWVAMGLIIYFQTLTVPSGLGGVGVGLIYLVYLIVIVLGTIFLFLLSKSNKQFFKFASIPFLFTAINLMIMVGHQ